MDQIQEAREIFPDEQHSDESEIDPFIDPNQERCATQGFPAPLMKALFKKSTMPTNRSHTDCKMVEYRPGRPVLVVYRWMFHINSYFAKSRL